MFRLFTLQFWLFYRLNNVFDFYRMLNNNQAPVLDLMFTEQKITIHNVRLFLGKWAGKSLESLILFSDN